MISPNIIFSVVSHKQGDLVRNLFDDFDRLNFTFQVILTLNLPEDVDYIANRNFPIKIVTNKSVKGFGENHNHAFKLLACDFFIVINPDIRITKFDIQDLLSPFGDERIGVCGPQVLSLNGAVEDSARKSLTPARLFKRIITFSPQFDYQYDVPFFPDWIAGMFMIFRYGAFKEVDGFNSKDYFMYCEDMDICRSLWRRNWAVFYNPSISVLHNARRDSRRNLRYLLWHISSIVKYFLNRTSDRRC